MKNEGMNDFSQPLPAGLSLISSVFFCFVVALFNVPALETNVGLSCTSLLWGRKTLLFHWKLSLCCNTLRMHLDKKQAHISIRLVCHPHMWVYYCVM